MELEACIKRQRKEAAQREPKDGARRESSSGGYSFRNYKELGREIHANPL